MKKLIFLATLLAQMTFANADPSSPPGSVLSSSGGRFVFGQVSEYRRDQYMIDTQTGRLWQMVCAERSKDDATKCESSALSPVIFADSKGNYLGTQPAK